MRFLVSAVVLVASTASAFGQEPSPLLDPTACPKRGADACGVSGWKRSAACFPRCGCPDDYCPSPLPRQCWTAYPYFYQCVPAGSRCPKPKCETKKDGWAVWFLPTPRTLKDAIWCQP